MKIDISNLKQTESLGKQIGEFLVNFNGLAIFYLDGNLGTGKTTLVREILKAMSWQGAVKSPTFSILEEYQIANKDCLLYTSPSPRDSMTSRMPSSA